MALKWIAISALALGVLGGGCSPEGVGDPCVPEQVPCLENENGMKDLAKCGFSNDESFVESSSVQCKTRTCIVQSVGGVAKLRDPRDVCGRDEGRKWLKSDGSSQIDGDNCVKSDELSDSVFCTCRCKDGEGKKIEGCDCSEFPGFECREVLTLGGDGIRGSYCVRPQD